MVVGGVLGGPLVAYWGVLWWCSAGWHVVVLMGNLAWCGVSSIVQPAGVVLYDGTVRFLLGVWICVLWIGICVVFRGVDVVCLPHAVSFSGFCKHVDFVLPYVYMVVQVSDCEGGGDEPDTHWAGEHILWRCQR